MELKTFEQEMPNEQDEIVIYKPDSMEKEECWYCKKDNDGHFKNTDDYMANEVLVDCVKCVSPNSFSIKHRWEKIDS